LIRKKYKHILVEIKVDELLAKEYRLEAQLYLVIKKEYLVKD
jgi:hypothetical protein